MPIEWPDRYAPDRVAARVSNEITIAAPPSAVWAWLINATRWPEWYPNSSAVRTESGRPTLSPGERFTWRTFGVQVRSAVREFVPEERIAWDGTGFQLDVYHAWLVEKRTGGCWVLTEENQNGLAARVQALMMPNRMYRGHALWLTRLKAQAEGKPAPPV
jgi:uncharacterized protein YndB with AHSA1/START domain